MSLKKIVRIIANCPEKNLKDCVDDIKHPVVSNLETLKNILNPGEYVMKGTDYNKQKDFEGTLNVRHAGIRIQLESNFKFHHNLTEDSLIAERTRSGEIRADSTDRTYYTSSTKMLGERAMFWIAEKSMKCVSMDKKSVTLAGYGSSTSTEKYHCGATIKKVITKTGDDSFSIETHLDGKKAYHCDYTRLDG